MTDTFTREERSEIMRKVKSGKNKSTELKLIRYFKLRGIKGWRRNFKLFGKPDFVFPRQRLAIFADGCFWHGHNCRNLTPRQNNEYWQKKISRNRARDENVTRRLQSKNWQVVRIWECELKSTEKIDQKLSSLAKTD